MKMKWFKFQIYCGLFLTVLYDAFNAYNLFGILVKDVPMFDIPRSFVTSHPEYVVINSIFGFLFSCLLIFDLYTRFRLAGHKKNGPVCFYLQFGIRRVIELIYITLMSFVFAGSSVTAYTFEPMTMLRTLIMAIAYIYLNMMYFRKRADLFTE